MKIFVALESEIDAVFRTATQSLQSGWISDLLMIAQVSISLYVVVFGYMVLAGKIQTPFQDMVWTLAKFGFILAVISNSGGWLDMVNESVSGVKNWFSGSDSVFGILDTKFHALFDLAQKIWNDASGIKDSILAVFRLAGLLPLTLGFVSAGALVIYTEITLKLLMATAPIFLFCLMWGFLRDSFNNWISAIIGNCLVLLFTRITMELGYKMAALATTGDEVEASWLIALFFVVIAGILNLVAIKWGREMALNIARVSVDGTIGGGKATESATAHKIGQYINRKMDTWAKKRKLN